MKPITLVLTLLLAAMPALAQKAVPPSASGCARLLVSSPELANGAFAETFSASAIVDLEVSVLFDRRLQQQLMGDHTVEVRVFTPRGHLYQSMEVPFTADPQQRGRSRRLEDYPQPVQVTVLASVKHGNTTFSRVTVRLPVAGTSIVTSSLYGTWRAEAYVDGRAVACAPDVTFSITQ